MFLDHKKGMEENILVYLIIGIITFALAIYGFKYWYDKTTDAATDEGCTASLKLAAGSKTYNFHNPQAPLFPVKCPRKELLIKKTDVVVDDKIDQDKAGYLLADSLYRCYNKVGRGAFDPFSNMEAAESYCLICDVIKYDDELVTFMQEHEDQVRTDPTQLNQYFIHSPNLYMATHTIPKGKDKGKTYWETVYGFPPPSQFSQTEITATQNNIILPNSAILFSDYKAKGIEGAILNGGAIGAGLGIVGGIILVAFLPLTVPFLVGAMIVGTTLGVSIGAAGAYATAFFSDCEECNGIAGIFLIPQQMAFTEIMEFHTSDTDGKPQTTKAPLCTILMN